MEFRLVGEIKQVEVVARGRSIRELRRLKKAYGSGRWRKLKGVCQVQLRDGTVCKAEVHWYEAHGIGKKEFKIKRIVQE